MIGELEDYLLIFITKFILIKKTNKMVKDNHRVRILKNGIFQQGFFATKFQLKNISEFFKKK